MSLSILVTQEKWQDFDAAWEELMTSDGPVDDLLRALRLVGEKKRMPRCLNLLKEHANLLAQGSRAADGARVIGTGIVGGAAGSDLSQSLFDLATAAWGGEAWWAKFTELSGFAPNAPDMRKAWQAFEKLCAFQTGTLVFHPGGWGTGEVIETRPHAAEIVVRFANNRRDTFPLSGAVDIFDSLSEDDLRALHFRDPARMQKTMRKEPLEILRMVVTRYHGRANVISIRNALMQVGIEGSGWTAWWRKARKLAENSEWYRVTGTAQKGEVQLLLLASDPVADARRMLERTSSLLEATLRVREILASGDVTHEMRDAALAVLTARGERPGERQVDRLAAWMLVREIQGESPAQLVEAVRALLAEPEPADPAVPPRLFEHLHTLPTARDQERAFGLLNELHEGDVARTLDLVAKHLHHVPPGMLRGALDAIVEAGRHDCLVTHYATLLAHPMRSPNVLVSLAKLVETKLPDDGLPTPPQRAQGLLSLATYLWLNRRGNPHLNRVHTRLVDLLTKGKNALLPRLLEHADSAALRSAYRVAQRGVDEAIDYLVTDLALHATEDARTEPAGFWADETRIWTTRRGLDARRRELRELHEVHIPANSEAIGRAASMGDISENAEWEAAIEEQRNLAAKAGRMESELRAADVIEDAVIPDNTVCPGTAVRYRDLATGLEHDIQILGPWDTDLGDNVVSYRAPLAAGLLGLHHGDRAVVELPTGPVQVEVLEVKTIVGT